MLSWGTLQEQEAWSRSKHSSACYACCQEFCLSNILLPCSFKFIKFSFMHNTKVTRTVNQTCLDDLCESHFELMRPSNTYFKRRLILVLPSHPFLQSPQTSQWLFSLFLVWTKEIHTNARTCSETLPGVVDPGCRQAIVDWALGRAGIMMPRHSVEIHLVSSSNVWAAGCTYVTRPAVTLGVG